MGRLSPAEEALTLLRSRLCNPSFVYAPLVDDSDSNYSKLKVMISSSITEACNNSVLLLGPRGCGKIPVLDLVLDDLLKEYPEMITVIKLSGLLHSDDNCAIKEIARQLCEEHGLSFSKMASFDDNTQFMIAMLRECGLAHKTVIFVLDEFDLFAQGKQRLLYSLLDAMQSVTSQAVVVGVSCRVDADQLLEKRVRSRFSHRKLLFLPPSKEDLQSLLKHILVLPTDSSLPPAYVTDFNSKLHNVLDDKKFNQMIDTLSTSDSTFNHFVRFLFLAVSHMNLKTGFLSLENFEGALSSIQRQLKRESLKGEVNDCNWWRAMVEQEGAQECCSSDAVLEFHDAALQLDVVKCSPLAFLRPPSADDMLKSGESVRSSYHGQEHQAKTLFQSIQDCSVLELYLLVCMRRLEVKEQDSYNFNAVMKEYKSVHDTFQSLDYYARNVCLRAFEHLLERELICYLDNRGQSQSVEFRPVKLLISYSELHECLKTYRPCPVILLKIVEGKV